jgi:hypothetical protein
MLQPGLPATHARWGHFANDAVRKLTASTALLDVYCGKYASGLRVSINEFESNQTLGKAAMNDVSAHIHPANTASSDAADAFGH